MSARRGCGCAKPLCRCRIRLVTRRWILASASASSAVIEAMRIGAIGFDAVKQLVLARVEQRPARLDLARYPYLPAAHVRMTAAADYSVLLRRDAA